MPFVTVKTVKGVFNEIQKQEILDGISELITRVAAGEDKTFKEAIWAVIEEEKPGNWYLGGSSPNPEMLAYQRKSDDSDESLSKP